MTSKSYNVINRRSLVVRKFTLGENKKKLNLISKDLLKFDINSIKFILTQSLMLS